jgi:hypothetical protein
MTFQYGCTSWSLSTDTLSNLASPCEQICQMPPCDVDPNGRYSASSPPPGPSMIIEFFNRHGMETFHKLARKFAAWARGNWRKFVNFGSWEDIVSASKFSYIKFICWEKLGPWHSNRVSVQVPNTHFFGDNLKRTKFQENKETSVHQVSSFFFIYFQ